MQKTLPVHPALSLAFETYLDKRDNRANDEDFDKEKYRGLIFEEAKSVFGENLVYAESCAASYFFHVKNEEGKVEVWETHLQEKHREQFKGFTVLEYSWLNKDFKEEPQPEGVILRPAAKQFCLKSISSAMMKSFSKTYKKLSK